MGARTSAGHPLLHLEKNSGDAWLDAPVDPETFPNVHPSYTRREAFEQASQVMLPADYFGDDDDTEDA